MKNFPREYDSTKQLQLFVKWCEANNEKFPALQNIIGIPNVAGKTTVWMPKRFTQEGVRIDTPDLFLPHSTFGKGLFYQFKVAEHSSKNHVHELARRLRKSGYQYFYAPTWLSAVDFTLEYFKGVPFKAQGVRCTK